MLRQLSASDARFKTINFHDGLNVLVADTTAASRDTDSRNSAGKSSMIELLHFLLGGNADRGSLPAHRALRGITFRLGLDWPGLGGILVQRTGSRPGSVMLDPLPYNTSTNQLDFGSGEIPLDEWRALIERDLFQLPPEPAGVSGRGLLSFLMRRDKSGAFLSPTRSHSRHSDAEGTTNLAYLLGLDWQLADRYRALKARETTSRELRKAVSDPILGRIVGQASELRGQLAVAEHRVSELERQVAAFRVVPEHETLSRRADAIDRRIRALRNEDVVDRRNLADLEKAVEEAIDPDVDYLEATYAELGVVLGDQVRRSFADVQTFHESVVRNRRRYLGEEAIAIRARLTEREAERERLGVELATVLRDLNEGGALDALSALQQILAQERAVLASLQHRYEAAQTVESSRRIIAQDRIALQQEVDADISERRRIVNEAVVLFSDFAQTLYGGGREAYLRFGPGESSLRIEPHIASQGSGGINSMVIFCFDLTVAVLAHRGQRAPDFLVHDSHLFDGVDERQLARALNLAADVTRREGMQYIVTMNSDELDKAVRRGFDPRGHVIEQRLTDAYDEGGLFGFRF